MSPKPKAPSPSAALQLLPELLRAINYGDVRKRDALLAQMVEALGPRHPALVQRLQRSIPKSLEPLPQKPAHLAATSEARFGFDGVVMPPETRAAFQALVQEHQRAEELRAFQLAPRHRVLLFGPPGNGKTMMAEALAKELDVMFLTADYSGLVDSRLGVTSRNIAELFKYANAVPCVLFLDEFDALGSSRSESHDVREFRRVTNQLLVTLDQLSPQCVLVAATNADTLIDGALMRRFDTQVKVDRPTRDLVHECALRELDPAITPGYALLGWADRIADLGAANLDQVVKLCRRLRRDAVLNQGQGAEAILAEFSLSRPSA